MQSIREGYENAGENAIDLPYKSSFVNEIILWEQTFSNSVLKKAKDDDIIN